uniref:Outer dynein arm-docking complex subunit 4 n=1 Tax=Myripristis murdjan TaxID=586833 RepID=A0A667XPV5_9TELE
IFDDQGGQRPKSTFLTYVAEGDQLYHKGEYVKAIESFSTALILQPGDKSCLVARSKCYLKTGDPENALRDAEASLKEDKEFFKGLYQKAEALYIMGDFEYALVSYHRGHRLRPELQEFRLGIQKAQEAIENSVGSKCQCKMSTIELIFHAVQPLRRKQKLENKKTTNTEKTTKQLLGELYTDKEYLEELLEDEDLVKSKTRSGEKLQDLILNCITYLDTRTEFWHQQRPIYARERDRKLMQQKWNKSRQNPSSDPAIFVLKSLEDIDAALISGNAEGSLKRAQNVMKTVQGWSEKRVPNKNEVIASLHNCIGNAFFDLGDMDRALEQHQKDLKLAVQCELSDAKSRALDSIGRVYARIGKFAQAIEVWEEKIPLVRSGLEKTWLFHEIGRCYLELKRHTEALDYGYRSLAAADEIADEKWQLNACVLVAQSELELGNFKSSVSHFERALDRATLLQDSSSMEAIQKVPSLS